MLDVFRFHIVFLLFFMTIDATAQVNLVRIKQIKDSLALNEVQASSSLKANLLFELGNLYESDLQYNSAIDCFEKIARIPQAKEVMGPRMWYNLANSLGMDYRQVGQYPQAASWLKEAVNTSEQNNLMFSGAYVNLFDLYSAREEYGQAKIYADKFNLIASRAQSPSKLAMSHLIMSRLSIGINHNLEATQHARESVRLFKEAKDNYQLAHALYTLGVCLLNEGKLDEAQSVYEVAAKEAQQHRLSSIPYIQAGLAMVKVKKREYDEAILILKNALNTSAKTADSESRILILSNLSKAYAEQKKYDQAIEYALQCKQFAYKIASKANIRKIHQHLSQLYAKKESYKQAFENALYFRNLSDSVLLAQQDMKTEMENKLKEAEYATQLKAEELKTRNFQLALYQNLVVLGLIIVFGVIGFLFYRNRLLNAEKQAWIFQEEARRKNEELRAFNYSVGHDLKSPITSVHILFEKLSHSLPATVYAENRLLLEQASALLIEAQGMIEGVLRYAEQDQLPISNGKLDTLRVIQQIVERVKMEAPRCQFDIELNNLPLQTGDPLMLRQVFTNLIQNAVKFSSGGTNPFVRIKGTTTTKNTVVYSVEDNGVGFPPEVAEKIFDLFWSAHDRAEYKGTGVGLAIVKRIVERHGGRAWASSRPEGGATFYVELPINTARH
jgi:signal transduction histidine kinase/tetratricopeptide (TPR) repeat protein